MKTRFLLTALALLAGLALCSRGMAATGEVRPATTSELNAPTAAVVEAPVDSCGCCQQKKSCGGRFLEWLTYQPLCKGNKCCKIQPMPCCQPRLYWFFPCVDSCGQCPMGGYTTKSCGCQH